MRMLATSTSVFQSANRVSRIQLLDADDYGWRIERISAVAREAAVERVVVTAVAAEFCAAVEVGRVTGLALTLTDDRVPFARAEVELSKSLLEACDVLRGELPSPKL